MCTFTTFPLIVSPQKARRVLWSNAYRTSCTVQCAPIRFKYSCQVTDEVCNYPWLVHRSQKKKNFISFHADTEWLRCRISCHGNCSTKKKSCGRHTRYRSNRLRHKFAKNTPFILNNARRKHNLSAFPWDAGPIRIWPDPFWLEGADSRDHPIDSWCLAFCTNNTLMFGKRSLKSSLLRRIHYVIPKIVVTKNF